MSPVGDRSIAFVFYSSQIPVIINGRFMTLFEAIGLVAEHSDNLTHALWGHGLYFDEDDGIVVVPEDDAPLYYQPVDCNLSSDIFQSLDRNPETDFAVGDYANDLAYTPDINESMYVEMHYKKNILQIAWELQLTKSDSGQQFQLNPIKPVIVTRSRVKLDSTQLPMELGISYSWIFWTANSNANVQSLN